MRHLASLIAGLLFGFGLALAQMTNPAKVLSFLDITGQWDPTLALVLGGAVAVTGVSFRLILRHPKPVLGPRFQLPSRRDIDARLIVGAAVFGVGGGSAVSAPARASPPSPRAPGSLRCSCSAWCWGCWLFVGGSHSRRSVL